MSKHIIFILLAFVMLLSPAVAAEKTKPVIIGDSFPYTAFTGEGALYKKGWTAAVEEINANGGLLGQPVKVISRDHGATPEEGIRVAQDFVEREKVDVLAGTGFASVTNAIANYTSKEKIPFVTMWNTTDAADGKQNDYMFSVISSESLSVPLADYAAKLKVKRWALISPNFAYGRLVAKKFKERLKKLRPDVVFVAERFPTVGKINAAGEIMSLIKEKPEAIFSGLFASDFTAFVRAGNQRNFFDDKIIVAPEAGRRVYTKTVGKELRGTWYVTGDPEVTTDGPAAAFYEGFEKRFGTPPDGYVYAGYLIYKFIFAAIEKAGSTDPDKVAKALGEVELTTPLGIIRMSPKNHRSNYGTWVGRLQPTETSAKLVDWEYKDAGLYLGME